MEGNPGGAPVNVLAMAAKLGCHTSVISKVGRDDFGDFLLSRIREAGIDTKNMTSTAAERFGIKERGFIREGYYADITVFDEKNIAPGDSNGRPKGISSVIVNGQIAVNDGVFTGNGKAGKFLLQRE